MTLGPILFIYFKIAGFRTQHTQLMAASLEMRPVWRNPDQIRTIQSAQIYLRTACHKIILPNLVPLLFVNCVVLSEVVWLCFASFVLSLAYLLLFLLFYTRHSPDTAFNKLQY